ncbi:sugar ABC transporter substrate-binding protein, partial [Paenibacillus sp. TAF58]
MLKKKAFVSFALTAALMVVAGCGQKGTPAPAASAAASATPAATAAAQKSYKVAISQIVEHPSLDATRQGFLA